MSIEKIEKEIEIPLDHQHILNLSNKIIGKSNIAFPVVETYYTTATNNEKNNAEKSREKRYSRVTFVYSASLTNKKKQNSIYLIGNFDALYKKKKMHQVFFDESPTRFWAITLKLPTNHLYKYRFLVNNSFIIDPLNTLAKDSDNNIKWSLFFTDYYKTAVILEKWELEILQRLTAYILPFKTNEFTTFVNQQQSQFNNSTKTQISQLNYDVGCVNFIDKLIAKDEPQHIITYKICLKEIKRVLVMLNSFQEPKNMDDTFYQRIYQIMNKKDFTIWNKDIYEDPSYFLKVLRRHIITATFSHPKHGGNTNALGWQFLDSVLSDGKHENAGYDWQQAMEKPLGTNQEYIG